jgi:hypothetical protein
MNTELQGLLCKLTDEDFYELSYNVNISERIRELETGENAFEMAEIMDRFDFTAHDMIFVINGAFDFTTRHEAVLKVMEDEKAFFDMQDIEEKDDNQSADDAYEEMLNEEMLNDVPDKVNYDIHDREPGEDFAHIEGGNNSFMTEEEEWELEHGTTHRYIPPIHTSKAYDNRDNNPFQEEMDRVFNEHQEKIKNSSTDISSTDTSLIEFMDQ